MPPLPDTVRTARARYDVAARASLAASLDAPVAPTVCFSDTHLVARVHAWSDDAPEDLLALLDALPAHAPLSLGDLTESAGTPPSERHGLATSARLTPLWERLRARGARVVIGNHDVGSEATLRGLFGDANTHDGGFELHGLRVRHGHEGVPGGVALLGAIGPVAVPLYEWGRRRLRRPAARLGNEGVLARVRGDARCVLFGHTHRPTLSEAACNPGCFLGAAQSFLLLDGVEAALYRRV